MNLNKRGKTLVSSLITISVIAILLFATTANAVNIDLATNKDQYTATETVTFSVSINIDTDERIPIDSLKLQIFDNSLPFLKECIFKPTGEKISGCNNLIITPTSTGNYGSSEELYGYGYGESGNNEGTFFGYGYGYGGTGYGYQGLLSYTITWTPSADGISNGNFKAALKINSVGEVNSYIYNKDSNQFSVGACVNGDTKPCGSSNVGECKYGTSTCVSGQWSACVGNIEPTTEVCNTKDDDCDGLIDEYLVQESSSGSNVGECRKEKFECISGSWVKTQSEKGPTNEVCDGLDNDCDGSVDEGNVCFVPPPPPPPPPPTYSCTGTAPANSQLCSDDNLYLTANTPKTLVESCTDNTKCEYICSSGYIKSGDECVLPPTTYKCAGAIPANSELCPGDNTGLMQDNIPRTLVFSCGAAKCEYVCKSGYTNNINSCTLQAPASCTGTIPANSELCPGDNENLVTNTARNLVSSCGTDKCEYTCKPGYEKLGSICLVPIPPAPNQCNDGLDNDNDGFTDLNDVDCISLTDNTESGSLQVCKPFTTAVCGVGGTKTCNVNGSWEKCTGEQPPKIETKQDVLIPVIQQTVKTLSEAEQTLSKIDTNKEETGLELSLSTNEQQVGSITVKVYEEVPAEQSFTIPGLTNPKFIVIEPEESIENDVKQALLKLSYRDPEDLGDTPESDLRMYYYSEDLQTWVQEPNSGVNTEENYVWAITDHLSLFTMGESSEPKTYYYDGDGDGYGTSDSKLLTQPLGPYRALQKGDCYDAEPLIYPGAIDFLNNRDDNCNGQIDEGFPSTLTTQRYTNPKVNNLLLDWHVSISPTQSLPYFDYTGLLAAELYCKYEHNSRSAGFQIKKTVNANDIPNGVYTYYKPTQTNPQGFTNPADFAKGSGISYFEWIDCLTNVPATTIVLPDVIEDTPKVLHRTVKKCATNAVVSAEQTIRLDIPYINHSYYTNYKCVSRYNEMCTPNNKATGNYYDEWCEY